jgi:transcriptional regulator with XRE-family HTH domain
MSSIDQSVADNVRAAMARRRITQSDLATALGVSQPAVSARLAGRTPFTVAELATAARVVDVPLSQLLPDAVAS